MRQALARLRAEGATAVYDALYAGITLSEGERRALIVLFTDGEDNTSWLGMPTCARSCSARTRSCTWSVGVRAGARIGRQAHVAAAAFRIAAGAALREIAEAAGGRYWQADSPDRLRRAFSAIADAMGHRYVLRYEPTGVPREGWHRIAARLRGAKGDVHVRRGYWVAAGASAQP